MGRVSKVRSQRRRERRIGRRYVPIIELLEDRVVLTAVQFDVSSIFNADVIINGSVSSVDTVQDPVDRHIYVSDHAFLTQSAANSLGGSDVANGLPDDGSFSSGVFHPEVELGYSDLDDGLNARRADTDTGLSAFDFTVNVPNDNYSQVHLFLTAGDITGLQATAHVTLTYTDLTTTTASISIPDWINPISSESFSAYNLITGLDRAKIDASSYEDINSMNIFGFGITADPTKELQSITIDSVAMPSGTGNTGSIVFFGATGVIASSVTLSGPSVIKAGDTYTLDLSYFNNEPTNTLSVDWGDGSSTFFDGTPPTATHVYQTAPSLNTISAVIHNDDGDFDSFNTIDVSVPTLEISGNPSVLVGQPYTLNLQCAPSEATSSINSVVIDWGDGSIQAYEGAPTAVTHVYSDAPNGYVITAHAVGTFGTLDSSNSQLVTVTVPEDGSTQASNVVEGGNTETFTVGGISATTINTHRLNNIIVTLGVYHDNPVDNQSNTVVNVGGQTLLATPSGTQVEIISYELRATTPLPGDVIIARFTIPNGGFLPGLFFFDDVTKTYLPVHGSTKIANSFVQMGNVFQVIFDETSFPSSLQLRGTVFTITDAQALVPSLIIVAQPLPARPPINTADLLGSLLDTGSGGRAPTVTVGVVAPTQVNAFQAQNITSAAESPESAEGRRLSRQIQSVLDGVYEQMRNIFLPQLYFDPTSATPPPASAPGDAPPSAAAPVRGEEMPELSEEIALTPVRPEAKAIEIALGPIAEVAAPSAWLFSRRVLVCLSIAALPMMLPMEIPVKTERKAPNRKRKARR